MYEVRDPLDLDHGRAVRPAGVAGRTALIADWWAEWRLTLTVTAGYVCAVAWLLEWHSLPAFRVLAQSPPLYFVLFVGAHVILIGLGCAAWRWTNRQPLGPLGARIPGAITVTLFVPLVMTTFMAWKQAMPHLVPYRWDESLHALSVALHGVPEWQRVAWVYELPALVRAIDTLYMAGWMVPFFLVLTAMVWHPQPALRRRFYLAWLVTWISLGSVLALVFGSGGPVFYDLFVSGPDPYVALRDQLARYPSLLAPQIADSLRDAYTGTVWRPGAGISAFPSLHVAHATLMALLFWQSGYRLVRVLSVAYVAAILIGSVVLGWHYAIDGYVSIVLTVLIWRVTARAVSRDLV